jgi:hypothetical protein
VATSQTNPDMGITSSWTPDQASSSKKVVSFWMARRLSSAVTSEPREEDHNRNRVYCLRLLLRQHGLHQSLFYAYRADDSMPRAAHSKDHGVSALGRPHSTTACLRCDHEVD